MRQTFFLPLVKRMIYVCFALFDAFLSCDVYFMLHLCKPEILIPQSLSMHTGAFSFLI